MNRHRLSILAVTVLAVIVTSTTVSLAVSSQPAEAAPQQVQWAALGDSFSAGVGLGAVSNPCDRDSRSHGPLAARTLVGSGKLQLKRPVTHVACSGAVISDYWVSQKPGVDPQRRAINKGTDLVSLTMGGNDVSFAGKIYGCFVGTKCGDDFNELSAGNSGYGCFLSWGCIGASSQTWDGLYELLVQMYSDIRTQMSDAGHLFVLSYPIPFALSGQACETLSFDQQVVANAFATRLGDTIFLAAQEANKRKSNVHFVDWRSGTRVRGLYEIPAGMHGAGQRYDVVINPNGLCNAAGRPSEFNGIAFPVPNSFHPTAYGYEVAAGRLAAAVSQAYPTTMTRPTPTVRPPPSPLPPSLGFVNVRETGEVYRIAGGAPIYVSSWSAFGGPQRTVSISQAALNAMPQFPADGTFIRGTARGEVYRVAGGAPLYVSTWSAFGGPQPYVDVDQAAIDNAGAGGAWNHLRFLPADGTFIIGGQTGRVYEVRGGAPYYVPSWDPYGGPRPTVSVDQAAIDNAGTGGLWNHLKSPTAGTATAIAAGADHTCAIVAGGRVKCWGSNFSGELGDGTNTATAEPVVVNGVEEATSISAGGGHTCAVVAGGTVKCWGANRFGQLGDGSTTDRSTAVAVSGISSATQVSAGHDHTCALIVGGVVKCWGYNGPVSLSGPGYNGGGELGDGTTTDRLVPVTVDGISGATQVSAGVGHTCATVPGAGVKCWGANDDGEIGDGTRTERLVPATVTGLSDASHVGAGGSHTCAVTSGGIVKCWGSNLVGLLGNGTGVDSTTPVTTSGLTGATQISAGGAHTCALVGGGNVKCWGSNSFGRLGDGTSTDRPTPVFVAAISDATEVRVGGGHSCALLRGGNVRCWGINHHGQLGDGSIL